MRARGRLAACALNEVASKTSGAIAFAPRVRSNAGKDNDHACAFFFCASKIKHVSGTPRAILVGKLETRSIISKNLFRLTFSDQPRRAGDSKLETGPVEALRCNDWFGSFLWSVSNVKPCFESSLATVRAVEEIKMPSFSSTQSFGTKISKPRSSFGER